MKATAEEGRVLFVVPKSGESPFGFTSPEPSPSWKTVADHLAERISGFDSRLRATTVVAEDVLTAAPGSGADLTLILGVKAPGVSARLEKVARQAGSVAVICYDCSSEVAALQRVGAYASAGNVFAQDLQVQLLPWAGVAIGKRLSDQADLLLSRNSSEDLLYAIFFVLHQYVLELELVKYTVNPTWEKGPLRNAQEFAGMCSKCRDEIYTALTDPETKATIDLLNACDMRDQVGSYRVIVSYETPQLEAFSLCILQQNNVFGCSADILETPRVPVLRRWQGLPLDDAAARQIFIGHLDCPEAAAASTRKAWSWKVVCGANPAYDAFPSQHQIFYPSEKSKTALWYDPVFQVETLDGRKVWTKRHYRCMPRTVSRDLGGEDGSSAGAWTLTTLDNGVLSKESWTTVDVADDLSWAVFHYSGAAAVVGQSYLGGLLCTADGAWPKGAESGPEFERIQAAFRSCGIEMWELYGHGPPAGGNSFMWTTEQHAWIAQNPPPLEQIGDQTVQQWRKSELAGAA